MKKICVYATSHGYNRQVRLDYLEKIMPKDVEIFFFTLKKYKDKYNSKKIKIVDTNCGKFNCLFELREFCRENKIDVLINLGQMPQEGYLCYLATLGLKTKYYSYMVGDPFAFWSHQGRLGIKSAIEGFFFFPLMFFPKKNLFCSKDILEEMKKKMFCIKNKFLYLPGTVDINLFKSKSRNIVRKKLKIGLNKKIVVYVGRIEYEKGSDIFLKLAEENKDIYFLLIGQLQYRELEKKNLENIRIISPMPSKKLIDYYNAADLCVFPSRVEGFGLVPREAMACEIPTVVSGIRALRMLDNAIKSKLDWKGFNKKIKDFFKLNKKQKLKIGKESRKEIIEKYGGESCKELYLKTILN